MAAELLPMLARAGDSNNNPLSGALWYFYATDTLTPRSVYTTSALDVAHANPVVADSAGKFAPIYFDSSLIYRGVLKDADGATIFDVDPINAGVLSTLAASAGAASVGFIQSGTGATSRTIQAKARDTVSVKDFGAVGDGVTDDIAAFNAAIAAHNSVYIPKGTYALSTAITMPANCALSGDGSDRSILLFTGATDGLLYASNDLLDIRGINLQTSSASGGQALSLKTGGFGYVSDLRISYTGSGRWAYGIWANNWQVSHFYGVKMYQSCTVNIHFEYACNANHFYGFEFVGSSGAGTIERGIEMTTTDSLVAAGNLIFETYFHGGTVQGYYTKSLMNAAGCSMLVEGCHLENTNASPTDGADVWLDGSTAGAMVNSHFSHGEGGSFGTVGTIRNLTIAYGQHGAINLASGTDWGMVLGCRVDSITDVDKASTILGCSNSSGNPIEATIGGSRHVFRYNATSVFGVNAKGVGYTTNQAGSVTQATDKATGVTLNTPTGAITMNAAALAADTTASFTLTNSTIEANDHVVIQHVSGGTVGSYTVTAVAAAGSATVYLRNVTAGSLAEAVVLKFSLIKSSIAA